MIEKSTKTNEWRFDDLECCIKWLEEESEVEHDA